MLGSSGWGIVDWGRILDFNLVPQEALHRLGERAFCSDSPGLLQQGTDPGRATTHHRSQHASAMNGKSRRERVASMSLAERDDLIPLARKVRADSRRNALRVGGEAALSLHTEREHKGQGHGARLRRREDELCAAIEQAAEDIKTGPVTDDDLMIALAVRDSQKE